MDIEITKREILVSITIVLIMLGFGFFLSTKIHDTVLSGNDKYFRALKVDNDPAIFAHGIATEVGDIVSYGKVEANEPVSHPMIDGMYYAMIRIEEHYVMKTRIVTYTDSDGNSRTKTETYWNWDEKDREYFQTETFNYLGTDFDYEKISFNHYTHNTTVKDGFFSDVRYKFRTIPYEFSGTLYSRATSKTIEDTVFYLNMTIDDLMSFKEGEAKTSIVIFWIVWILITLVLVFVFVALDNRYLNGR